jgi:hypothetical protein
MSSRPRQQLGENEAPEHAQPLAVGEHGCSAASRLVSRLERPRFHTSIVATDRAYLQSESRAYLPPDFR